MVLNNPIAFSNRKFTASLINKLLFRNIEEVSTREYLAKMFSNFIYTQVSIPKGTQIILPVWAIHNDAKIFPNPELFDLERFTEENEKNRHPMNYLPFGDGPHNCIGMASKLTSVYGEIIIYHDLFAGSRFAQY